MYLPPLGIDREIVATWDYRKSLLRERIGLIDADVVCLQEVSPLSFETDFAFMNDDLGYDGVELFKKGRFCPATFWKKDRVTLAVPPQHKDRTLLTSFRLLDGGNTQDNNNEYWHVLNCHLQAGKQGGRRLRQIVEGITTAYKTAKNILKGTFAFAYHLWLLIKYANESCSQICSVNSEEDPENIKLICCGDFNGGYECGAVHYLEKGFVRSDFLEDGEQVTSKEKVLVIPPLIDAVSADSIDRGGNSPPATLVVPEIISLMIDQKNAETAYTDPQFSKDVLNRLHRIYNRFATTQAPGSSDEEPETMKMGKANVERWLTIINRRVGRGTEFRNAAKLMGWDDPSTECEGDLLTTKKDERPPIFIPDNGILTFDNFVSVYLEELRQGKFWGIAWDLATLGEPLAVKDVFRARYDRMYCSQSLEPAAVLDTVSDLACPNEFEPSDHLPVCASFLQRKDGRLLYNVSRSRT
jgi:endonuclease/exonuclease/phosphatase family metal-dependent hydrolase